jgi:hypothetical protein
MNYYSPTHIARLREAEAREAAMKAAQEHKDDNDTPNEPSTKPNRK